MEAKGILHSVKDGTKPFTRKEIGGFLYHIINRLEKGVNITKVEKEQLEFLKLEFKEELTDLGLPVEEAELKESWKRNIKSYSPGIVYKNNRNMFSIEDRNIKVYIDPIFRRDSEINSVDTLSDKDRVHQYTFGGKFWGTWGNNIGFFFRAVNTKEWGSRDYPDQYRIAVEKYGYANGYGSYIFHDETSSYIMFNNSNFSVEIGKDKNKWGYGFYGNLLLSDYATSYDMLKFQMQFWRLKFTSVQGFLRTYPPINEIYLTEGDTYNKRRVPKYLSAHRLEMNLTNKFHIGLQEAIVYGGRSLELSYINPLMFLRSAEHYLGDQDNALIGIDYKLLLKGLKFYGEFLIDDMTLTKLNTKWYGNKFGFLNGVFYPDPFGFENFNFRYEYARINHFVYSHTYPINVYKHYSTIIGHRIGPNADEHILNLNYYYSKKLFFDLKYTFFRHGANPEDKNIGGDINVPHRPGDSIYISFMEGEIETKNIIDFKIRYELLRQLFIRFNYNYYKAGNYLVKGSSRQDFTNKGFFLSLDLNL